MSSEAGESTPGAAAWKLIEPYWNVVDIYGEPDEFLSTFRLVPNPIGNLLAVWWCDSEVCNGGFFQFFDNSTGILAPEANRGFKSIGLIKSADIVDTAIKMFGANYPRKRERRRARLDDLRLQGNKRKEWDPFYQLDDSYYAAKEAEAIRAAMDRYAKLHAVEQ